MSTATAIFKKGTIPPKKESKSNIGKMTLQTFLDKYSNREDGYKYELVDGKIIKSRSTMTDAQQYIVNNLIRFFYRLEAQGKIQGNLAVEKDNHLTPSRVRRPDLCYMNAQHDYEAANGGHPVAEFVIEIVSPNDTADYYDQKLDNYFDAGVKVVWLIYPQSEKVQVYKEDKTSLICSDKMICSADPVLSAFAMPANDVFRKPERP
jgi:Uma2 family endonuclease